MEGKPSSSSWLVKEGVSVMLSVLTAILRGLAVGVPIRGTGDVLLLLDTLLLPLLTTLASEFFRDRL